MIKLPINQFTIVSSLFDKNMPLGNRIVSTLEGRTPGKVYVDRIPQPTKSVLTLNFYNITFLGGKIDQNWIETAVTELSGENEIVLVWPPEFEAEFTMPSGYSEVMERFEFYDCPTDSTKIPIPSGYQLKRIDKKLFEQCSWYEDMVLAYGSPENFLEYGMSLCMMAANEICCEAYAVFHDNEKFELGVVTSENHRRKGLAHITCKHLIQLCREKGFSTYWVCHQSNIASIATARKLEYKVQKEFKWLFFSKPQS